jgi:hypothetical protein
VVRQTIREFTRVLVAGGIYVGTMLSKRNRGYGVGREVRPDTFVVDGASDDKVHPHLYVNSRDVLALYEGFEVLNLRDVAHAPGTNHWECTFERLAA